MSRFAIAFFSEDQGQTLHTVEASSQNEALRLYFDEYVIGYSKDSEGFTWFKEDFLETLPPQGKIIEI